MFLADRIRVFREAKNLSQGDIEERTGLLRCYVSRVENGHTIPSLETLEKISRALEIPLHQLFYENGEPAKITTIPKVQRDDWASHGKGHRLFRKFQHAASRMSDQDRSLLLHVVGAVARSRKPSKAKKSVSVAV
ncbi:MAG TPA: helix-turn-helix transcriptional regulator [Candidatus Eisenbacteria bacterium]|nr:helix-turn-helix transcriptional regulator [Candidatus Eisenbacteria bacterium]